MDTIEFIKNVKDSNGNCGTYDHIAIGTDLDGFTEVPPDLLGEDQIQNLIPAMKNHGISQLDIKKICSGNYMRVLKKGWGNNR